MATKCGHYEHLMSRFRQLCLKFLDPEITSENADPAGYSPDLDSLAAFRLLFHAEIETFLEEKAREMLLALEGALSTGSWHRSNPQILSLYLLVKNYLTDKEEISDVEVKSHFLSVITSARSRVKDNNGIKAQSFAFLSVAAGKALDEVDATLSAMLNSYGKDRGEVAHGSAARSRSLNAPSAEKAVASAIVIQMGSYFDVSE